MGFLSQVLLQAYYDASGVMSWDQHVPFWIRWLGVRVFILMGIACVIFWAWALIDVIGNDRLDIGRRIAWILVVLFLFWFGAILYYFFRPKKA